MKLSKNFDLEELCYTSHNVPNTPGLHERENLTKLVVNILQPARDHFGKSITVNSGYRNPILNKLVKGAVNSDHIYGYAADLTMGSVEENKKLFEWIKNNCEYRQLIWEFGGKWVHCSYNESENKKQVLKIG